MRLAWGQCSAALITLLVIHALLVGYIGWSKSPTIDEPAHLVAGLSHWRFGDFHLYRVNPPLVRMVAALPAAAARPRMDWSQYDVSANARPAFALGETFFRLNPQTAHRYLLLGRWACIPFTVLGCLACYWWARQLYGGGAGLLAALLWCFAPSILGNAAFITPDAHAAALGLLACYLFWRWLRQPDWGRCLAAGVLMGLACLAKSTALLLLVACPLVWCLGRLPGGKGEAGGPLSRQLGMLLLYAATCLGTINLGYGMEGSFRPLGEYRFISRLFAGQPEGGGNRFRGGVLGGLPVPLPANLVRGIDAQQRDFEGLSKPSYLRGEFRDRGWYDYYLYAMLIKVPLGMWVLAVLVIVGRLLGLVPATDWRNDLALLLPAAAVVITASLKTGINQHMRYILPALPLLLVWISQVASARRGHVRFRGLAVVAISWLVASSLWCVPHNLAYFNETVGGPLGGRHHLLTGNLDWGQDLACLRRWLERERPAAPVFLAYYGSLPPRQGGLADTRPIPVAGDEGGAVERPGGWYAISVNLLQGYPGLALAGGGAVRRVSADDYRFFRARRPQAYAGYAIFIYRVEAAGPATPSP